MPISRSVLIGFAIALPLAAQGADPVTFTCPTGGEHNYGDYVEAKNPDGSTTKWRVWIQNGDSIPHLPPCTGNCDWEDGDGRPSPHGGTELSCQKGQSGSIVAVHAEVKQSFEFCHYDRFEKQLECVPSSD